MIAFITELTDDNYENFISSGLVLVDIHASWCGPCRIIGPIVDEISSDYKGKVSVGKLDADANRETLADLKVRNIPTILIYKDGEVVDTMVGVVSKSKIGEVLDKHLSDE